MLLYAECEAGASRAGVTAGVWAGVRAEIWAGVMAGVTVGVWASQTHFPAKLLSPQLTLCSTLQLLQACWAEGASR